MNAARLVFVIALFIVLVGASSAATEPRSNRITTVDSSGLVRSYVSSVAVGRDGLPVISYYRSGHLTVLHCGNRACSRANSFSRVDKQPGVGYSSSITIGADGLPLISYGSNLLSGGSRAYHHLKVVHCGNRACSRRNTITTVDKHPNVGFNSSVAIGADKRPVITYYDTTKEHLKVLHCGNRACTAGNTFTTVASRSYSGPLAIGRDGLPLIAYADADMLLKVLHCGNRACTAGNTTTTSLGPLDESPSLTIGRDGLPLISYVHAGLEVLHCGNRTCTSGNSTTTVQDEHVHGPHDVTIAIGADRLPVLGYLWGGGLKVLHCGNSTCSSGNTGYLVVRGSTTPSLAIGADRLPLVSYVAGAPHVLKVLHCGNTSCRPHR
jgi:hypothetical protein